MPMARAWVCSFRRMTVDDITLCASSEVCPLRKSCRRAWNGQATPMRQSWGLFRWSETSSGAACQHLLPRAEDSK